MASGGSAGAGERKGKFCCGEICTFSGLVVEPHLAGNCSTCSGDGAGFTFTTSSLLCVLWGNHGELWPLLNCRLLFFSITFSVYCDDFFFLISSCLLPIALFSMLQLANVINALFISRFHLESALLTCTTLPAHS